MAKERPSLQDRIRQRQRSDFTGRQGQVIQYRENLGLPVDDEQRRFLFNIHGDAGVGKTFLTRQLEQIASQAGALTAYMNETVEDVASAMSTVAREFSRSGVKLGDFEKRAIEYQQRRRELESDPHAPDGIAAFLTKTAVTISLAAVRDVPVAGSLLAPVDTATAADQVNRAREYLARKFTDHSVMRLLMSPAEELTPIFVDGLNRAAADHTIALFLDTYERTGLILDHWLHNLYTGLYGNLPETLITTISGQKPLNPNRWGEYLSVIADIPLEPFSEAEARQFLTSKHITDDTTTQVILTLSGRLPLWLATLADARPHDGANIGDPTGNAVERFLKWEDEPERRETAIVAALPRTLNQDVLAVITPAGRARDLFIWLRELPFVSSPGDSWVYHDVVRAAILRLRRAEAPAEWRSQHNSLAHANACWATEAVKDTDSNTWSNPEWIDYTREETYHLLCADPYGNLAKALTSAVKAANHSTIRARQWTALIADAGRDTNNAQLREWGKRLTDAIHDGDLVSYLTCLINDAHLDKGTLVVALEKRGEDRRLAGYMDDALTDFTRAVELDPEDTRAIARRGLTYRAMERYDDALTDFTRAIELNPENAWAIARRGYVHQLTRRYEDALTDFTRAIELDPEDAWAISRRGYVYQAMERYDDALTDFTRAIELDLEDAWALASRAYAYRDIGRYEDALTDLDHAIELNPEDILIIASRGLTHQDMGRYYDALTDFTRAVELDPEDTQVIASRGETYRLMGRYEDALTDFTRRIELDPEDAWAIARRGYVYKLTWRYEDALTDFTRAIELDPEDAWAIASRGYVYQAMGRYDDALTDLNHAIELNPDDKDYAAKRAEIHRLLGKSEGFLPEPSKLEPPPEG
jgi:tetratricopeptide (TPR) repeat protein